MQQVINPKRQRGISNTDPLSEAVCMVLNVQWEAVRQGLLEMVEARKAEQAAAAAAVDNVDALVAASKLCPHLSGPGAEVQLALLAQKYLR